MSIYLTVPGLLERHSIGDGARYVMVGEAGVWSVLTIIDGGRDLYRLQLIGQEGFDVRTQDLDECRPAYPTRSKT